MLMVSMTERVGGCCRNKRLDFLRSPIAGIGQPHIGDRNREGCKEGDADATKTDSA